MELSNDITLPEHGGYLKNCEVPANGSYTESKAANAGPNLRGLLHSWRGFSIPMAISESDGLLCGINTCERWDPFGASSSREAVLYSETMQSSSQFMFAADSRNYRDGFCFDNSNGLIAEERTRSRYMNFTSWNNSNNYPSQVSRGDVCREAMFQFTPVTPEKKKAAISNQQREVFESAEGRINNTIWEEVCVTGNNLVEGCFIKQTSGQDNLHTVGSYANLQVSETNNVHSDLSTLAAHSVLSTPVNLEKVWSDQISLTRDGHFSYHGTQGGDLQRKNDTIPAGVVPVDISSDSNLGQSLQEESQKLQLEESFRIDEQTTPQQKLKRRKYKHRPKVIIEDKQAKQKKVGTPKPVSTPEIPQGKRKYARRQRNDFSVDLFRVNPLEKPHVKRKYVRNEKKDLQEKLDGNHGDCSSNRSEKRSVKRTLNFDVEDPTESQLKSTDIKSSSQVVTQHKPRNGHNNDSINQNALVSAEVAILADQSQADYSIGHVPEECKNEELFIRTPQSTRKNGLKKNMKALARNMDDPGLETCLTTLGLRKNKRSKRERTNMNFVNKGVNFSVPNCFDMFSETHTGDPILRFSVPFIPEQCKRKRTIAGSREHLRDASSPSLISSFNQVSSSNDSQHVLTCVPAEEAHGCIEKKLKVKNTSVSQAKKGNLIAQANAMCFSQLPPIPQSSFSYYHNQASSGTCSVLDNTLSKVPKNKRTKKVQTHEVNRLSLEFRSNVTSHPHALLHSTFPSSNSFLKLVDFLVQKLICLNINSTHGEGLVQSSHHERALVVYDGLGPMVPFNNLSTPLKRKKPRPRVDLDSETNRVWLLLMGSVNVGAPEGTDVEKEKWWEEERKVFEGRAESFIARMHLVQGDRRFSPWKGSVVDSVVGVFLTQNVSDHLSSSAYMNLVARFPIRIAPYLSEVDISTEKRCMYIVEFEENNKKQEVAHMHISNEVMFRIPEDARGTVGKNISHDVQTNTEDMGSGKITVSTTGKVIHVSQSTAESRNCDDSDSIKSLDSTALDLNSVASSQNSSDYSIKENNTIEMGLQPHFDISELGNASTSTSFIQLLQLAESNNMINFLSRDITADVTNDQVYLNGDKKSSISDIFLKTDNSFQSISRHEFYFSKDQNDSIDIQPTFSHVTNAFHSDDLEKTMEKVDLPIENLSSFAATSVATTGYEIENTCNDTSVKNPNESVGHESSGRTSLSAYSCDSRAIINNQFDSSQGEVHSDQNSCNHNSPPVVRDISLPSNNCSLNNALPLDYCTIESQESSSGNSVQWMISKDATDASDQIPSHIAQESQSCICHSSSALNGVEFLCTGKSEANPLRITESNLMDERIHKEITNHEKPRRKRVEKTPTEPIDWDLLRKQACHGGVKKERCRETMDSVDWEAIRQADISELSDAIRERGMNNRLAQRIKEFLDRLVKDHGSIDLEWLRDAPPEKVKDYLLSVKGLGLKSVECVRLLTLHHLAFPVDTNVGRICVRLGWVPLQPLPESLQLHLLELYPILETIQKYLWPRLCKLDQRTLYELHYQMITFGKVFCTKSKPNCNACPMRGECKHFASAFASARLALPGPEEKGLVASTVPLSGMQEQQLNVKFMALPKPETNQLPEILQEHDSNIKLMALPQPESNHPLEEKTQVTCEPIIEEPTTPEPAYLEVQENEIEDLFYEDPDEIPTIKLDVEKFTQNLQNIIQESNMELQEADISKALVSLTPDAASIPQPKLKNINRLRTEHQVYELPDIHPLVERLDRREPDDPSPYLLAIWSPGETADSMELPEASCNSQVTGVLCDNETCSSCNSVREARAQIVRGTFLIPCRTAMRGSFPLNGTYFQVNEVFADHSSSLKPIDIPRQWIWNLPRRTVYFGTSVPTIFKGLTTEAIQHCFWRGFVCVRGFDRDTRAPRPLIARLHFPASKAPKTKKGDSKDKLEATGMDLMSRTKEKQIRSQ